jgi:hypothetical protein
MGLLHGRLKIAIQKPTAGDGVRSPKMSSIAQKHLQFTICNNIFMQLSLL